MHLWIVNMVHVYGYYLHIKLKYYGDTKTIREYIFNINTYVYFYNKIYSAAVA